MTDLSESIKKTIAYSQKYNGVLGIDQLEQRLLSSSTYSRSQIEQAAHKLGIHKTYVSLISQQKLTKAEQVVSDLATWQSILFVGITGSVAADNAQEYDDIDVMLVSRKDWLWITRMRLLAWLIIQKVKHRRYHQPEEKDAFCFNLWLDETSLAISPKRLTLKNAVDMVMMKVVINKENCYQRFLHANEWVKKYVATGYYKKISNTQFLMTKKNKNNKCFTKFINWLCYLGQRFYMRGKIGKGEVGIHKAYFYP